MIVIVEHNGNNNFSNGITGQAEKFYNVTDEEGNIIGQVIDSKNIGLSHGNISLTIDLKIPIVDDPPLRVSCEGKYMGDVPENVAGGRIKDFTIFPQDIKPEDLKKQ